MHKKLTTADRLRVYHGPNDVVAPAQAAPQQEDRVTVALGDVFPLLADALDTNRAWVNDFEDEEITVSADLYDVLMAYMHFNRTA